MGTMLQEPIYEYDALTQREIIYDANAAAQWVTHLETQGLIGEPARVDWLRRLGRLEEAEQLGWKVLHRSGGPAGRFDDLHAPLPLTAVEAAVRLAKVLISQGEAVLAQLLNEQALASVEAVDPLGDDANYADYLEQVVYCHIARCMVAEARYTEALDAAQTALQASNQASTREDQVAPVHQLLNSITSIIEQESVSVVG